MRLCAAGFTSSQRNPRYCEMVAGRSILTKSGLASLPPLLAPVFAAAGADLTQFEEAGTYFFFTGFGFNFVLSCHANTGIFG